MRRWMRRKRTKGRTPTGMASAKGTIDIEVGEGTTAKLRE